ncbi:hypothetical protein VE03_10756, partial [Pseudogymnoascus sp. 23342-1-I1]
MFPTISFISYAAITLLIFSQLSASSPVPICPISGQKDPQLPTTGKGAQLPDPSIGLSLTAFAYGRSSSSQFITLPALAAYISLPRVQELLNMRLPHGNKASVIGSHYFDAAGVPIFDLSMKDRKL